ncbi:Gfo/Idh/MocA family protein [Fusobacterium perfoetens]|uniref:Gfo/Idh/MocA family protein n=1 Tax=Fusobacterium perfoetens TaxID=852 RepID=UPI0026EE6136|nr:Gfo/Idh/MocA family oxidoreductase [Fusobacterium perfoetens]
MVRIGIAGIGSIAEEYIKLIVENKITNCKIAAFSSRNEVHMKNICEKYSLENVTLFTDYEKMLDSGLIDMVMICTPHFLYPNMAIKAVEKNIHPLIEKPIGVYSDEVETLIKLLDKKENIKSGVLYCRRTSKAFNKIKELIENGEVGEIKRVCWIITNLYRTQAYHDSGSWRGSYKGEGGGLLMTQASHQLDLLVWISPNIVKVNGFCYCGKERNIEVENDVIIQLEFENGATGQFIASSREFPGTNRLEISGSKGQIILNNDSELIFKKLEIDEREYSKTTKELFGKIPYTETKLYFDDSDNRIQQAGIVNNFIEALENNKKILCTPKDALKSLYIINGAYLSSWEKKEIEIPLNSQEFRKKLEEHF